MFILYLLLRTIKTRIILHYYELNVWYDKKEKKEQFGEIRMSVEINFFIIYCQRTENQASYKSQDIKEISGTGTQKIPETTYIPHGSWLMAHVMWPCIKCEEDAHEDQCLSTFALGQSMTYYVTINDRCPWKIVTLGIDRCVVFMPLPSLCYLIASYCEQYLSKKIKHSAEKSFKCIIAQ